ncbi:MAG: hypothetical protein ACRCSF_09620 [Mycobacteriaceae bacterium]
MKNRISIVGATAIICSALFASPIASATPETSAPVDPVAALTSSGIPGVIARTALTAKAVDIPACEYTIHLAGVEEAYFGEDIDAAINQDTNTITIIQRDLGSQPLDPGLQITSEVKVGWVNLVTGKSGVVTPDTVTERKDEDSTYLDYTTTFTTDDGPVLLVAWGKVPGYINIFHPLRPEGFGFLPPTPALVLV